MQIQVCTKEILFFDDSPWDDMAAILHLLIALDIQFKVSYVDGNPVVSLLGNIRKEVWSKILEEYFKYLLDDEEEDEEES